MPACLQLNCLDRFCWRSQIQLEDEGGRNKDVLLETFPRIILDAPDVPTWFFEDTVTTCAGLGIVFLHMFNPNDNATNAGRIRRAIDGKRSSPEVQSCVCVHGRLCSALQGRTQGTIQWVRMRTFSLLDAKVLQPSIIFIQLSPVARLMVSVISALPIGARNSAAGHDYGQVDSFVLIEQRDFLAGIPCSRRLLEQDEGFWKLKIG